jgi:signal peptidase II
MARQRKLTKERRSLINRLLATYKPGRTIDVEGSVRGYPTRIILTKMIINQEILEGKMFYMFLITLLTGIDQCIKYLVETRLKNLHTVPLIQDVFHLTYSRNTGAAFSVLRDKQMFLILVTLIMILALIFYLIKILKTEKATLKLSLALIIGGALGNFIDRVRLNYVVDFLDFNLINFPIFNFADVFVILGVIILLYLILFREIKL